MLKFVVPLYKENMKLLIKTSLSQWICLNFAKIPIFKMLCFITALFITACSSISKTPVKSVDVYIKPYYSAENGKAENVFVHKEIDPMLRENTLKGYKSAVKFVEESPARISPITMFTLSARAYDFGLRDEAVTWFYRGQNRLITALYVLDLPKQTVQDNTGFSHVVGQFVNAYAFCNFDKQSRAAENAMKWTITHPYEVIFLPALPSKFADRRKALKEAEEKLVQRLQEQARFFGNPKNKEKWQKERSENFVNERFCW